MRNIKKTLCFLLALVMMTGALSLFARRATAAATYKAYGIDISAWQEKTADWDQLQADLKAYKLDEYLAIYQKYLDEYYKD